MDFTLKAYTHLVSSLQAAGYAFFTFEDYCRGKAAGKYVILRHDVDLRAEFSDEMARVEAGLGIRASYYFRVVKASNKPEIIRRIAALGHEIGYHYEDLSIMRGDVDAGIKHFDKQLNYFRQYYPVVTICMHGSPTSAYDNRDLWKSFDYHDYGIIGEPYFDVNFDEVFYLTDTGRCWDGARYSVRDKVKNNFSQNYHSTPEIVRAAQASSLPDKIMITTHPQRWTNRQLIWLAEFLVQNAKNIIKRCIVR